MSASAAPAPTSRFEQLRAADLRVARIAYRLSIANAPRCGGTVVPQFGFVLHAIGQYYPADRPAAARAFGLGAGVAVMAVVDATPAAKAGLRAGDRLLSVNDHLLAIDVPAGAPSRAAVDDAEALLRGELHRGPVVLHIFGTGGARDIRLTAETGCPTAVELIPGDAVNAWADGSRVMVGAGLLRICPSDADLALVIGHEMAHNLLHHRARLAAVDARSVQGLAAMRQTEIEADRLAVGLATTARYDLADAATFLAGLLDRGVARAATHPDSTQRLLLLRLAITGIAQGAGAAGPAIANTASSGRVSGRI